MTDMGYQKKKCAIQLKDGSNEQNENWAVWFGGYGTWRCCQLVRKKFDVIGYDVRNEMKEWMHEKGGFFAGKLTELGKQCQTIICFVVNDEQTENVLFGEDGLVSSMLPGSVFIACSTMSPGYVSSLGSRLAEKGIELIDSPVTGGAAGAAKGTLTVISAGKKEIYDQIKPVLETFGSKLFFVSERHGAGSQLKVINQLLCGVHLAAAGEALALAGRQGLPLDITHQVLCSGAAFSWMLGDRGSRMTADQFSDVTSAVDIFVKDLGLVLESAKKAKFSAPLASVAFNAFIDVSGRGMGAWDDSAVICHYSRDPYSGPINFSEKNKELR